MENLNELIRKLTEFLKSEVKTDTIIGEQFQLGAFSCVPVMSVGLGFGTGGCEGKGNPKKDNEGPVGTRSSLFPPGLQRALILFLKKSQTCWRNILKRIRKKLDYAEPDLGS